MKVSITGCVLGINNLSEKSKRIFPPAFIGGGDL